MVTILNGGGASLSLSTNPLGWCNIDLHIDDQLFHLGADAEQVIVQRLRLGLEDVLKGPPAGKIQDIDVVWVVSLFERHASVFAAHQEGRRILFFQGEDGGLLARVELTDDERHSWITALSRNAVGQADSGSPG